MYEYNTERPYTLTDKGQRKVVAVFRKAQTICATAGVVRCDKLLEACGTGSSWEHLACIDRCVEMGLIREVKTENRSTQHKVYELA